MKAVYAPVWNEPYKDLFHRFLELWFHCRAWAQNRSIRSPANSPNGRVVDSTYSLRCVRSPYGGIVPSGSTLPYRRIHRALPEPALSMHVSKSARQRLKQCSVQTQFTPLLTN